MKETIERSETTLRLRVNITSKSAHADVSQRGDLPSRMDKSNTLAARNIGGHDRQTWLHSGAVDALLGSCGCAKRKTRGDKIADGHVTALDLVHRKKRYTKIVSQSRNRVLHLQDRFGIFCM
jgi:hypothetical protein